MKTTEQLKTLSDRIIGGYASAEEVRRKLNELLYAFEDSSYQEKIRSALERSDKYFSHRKSAADIGGNDQFLSHLLLELGSAEQTAKQLLLQGE